MKLNRWLVPLAFLVAVGCSYVTEDVGKTGSATVGCPSDDGGGLVDATLVDSTADVVTEANGDDSSVMEASVDAMVEAGAMDATFEAGDAAIDASSDAAADASADAALEASVDAAVDAGSSGPFVRQWAAVSQIPNAGSKEWVTLSQPIVAGDTIIAWATEYNINGSPAGKGAPGKVTVTDTVSSTGAYVAIDVLNMPTELQAVMSFARYNVAAAAAGVVVTSHYVGLEWQAIYVVEVGGVHGAPMLGHSANVIVNPANKALLSATAVSVTTVPAIALTLVFDVTDQSAAPLETLGAGETMIGVGWSWNSGEVPTTQNTTFAEFENLATTGPFVATAKSTSTDTVALVTVALQ